MNTAHTPFLLRRDDASTSSDFAKWLVLAAVVIVLREWALWHYGPARQDNWALMMQLLTVQDMRLPWSSLLYMHHQPPVWAVLQRFSNALFGDPTLIWGINKTATYITALCLRQVLLPWSGVVRANLAALAFLLLPETAVYEAWDYSSHFIMMLIAVNILLFSMMVRQPEHRVRWAWAWMANFMVLAFTRQTYQVAILVMVLWAFGALALRLPRKSLILMTVVLVTPVLAWQAKNEWLFGTSSMSSWATQNFYKIATTHLTQAQLDAAEAEGCGPVTNIKPFTPPEVYAGIPQVQAYVAAHQHLAKLMPQGVGQFNSLLVAGASPLYKDALVCILKRHPMRYLLSVAYAWGMYFAPSSDYYAVKSIAASWPHYDKAVRMLVYWQPLDDPEHEKNALKRLAGRSIMLLIVFGYFSVLALRSLWAARRAKLPRRRLILVYVMTLVAINGLSNFADFGENMRFRYEAAFAYDLGIVVLVARAWDLMQARLGSKQTPTNPIPHLDGGVQTQELDAADAVRRRA